MGDFNLDSSQNNPESVERRDADSTGALRAVIRLSLRTDLRRVMAGCPLEQSGIRENLRAIGAHARRHQLRAEQLLVMIKETCAALPEARELSMTPDGAELLSRLIPMAVDEYYGNTIHSAPRADP